MPRIDPDEYRQRLERISVLFEGIARHAGEQSLHRCPYKDRHDHCTAHFGCRNQGRPAASGLPACAGDDRLNYKSAWEV